MIAFAKHARRERTDVAERRIWRSRCGRFRVVKSLWLYGPQPRRVRYFAMVRDRYGWDRISVHRRKGPAFRACQRYQRTERFLLVG